MPLKICYDNQADEATVSEENSTLKLPPSNVQDQRLSRIYQGGESIDFNIYGSGAPKTISQAYTNEVQDPTDLRAAGANWTAFNTTDELSTLSINGNLFTKIINSGANSGYNFQLFGDSWTNLILTGHVILKKGSSAGNTALFMVRATTGTIATIFVISPDWDNYGSSPATPSNGILLDYNWIDSETLELFFQCDALGALTDDVQVRCFGSVNATAGENTYFSEVQLIDEAEVTKIISGLQSKYHFAENVLDSYGSNDGTAFNSPTYGAGISGQGIIFDGVNQYVTALMAAIGTQDFWVSCWFKPDDAISINPIVSSGNPETSSGNGFSIAYENTTLRIYFNDGSVASAINADYVAGDLSGAIHHVLCNFDRSGNVTVYLDDSLVTTTDISSRALSLTSTTLVFGKFGSAPVYAAATVDEINYGINDLLTTAEITELYNNPANVVGKTLFPFVEGTHTADVISETFTMPDKFVIRVTNIEPRSRFDMATQKTVLSWRIDGNNRLVIAYDPATDKYFVLWKNGTNAAVMLSQQFDSGSSFTDINQKLDMYIFLNLVSGGQTDSMFIVNPKESGAIFQDDSWSLTPDVKSSTFPTLSNGHENSISQLDGVEEKIEIIEWDGVKPTITTTALMDAYVEGKKVLLDLTYMNRLTATDLLIANSTINAGDTITLRGNDWDSFNSGTPVDESVTWSKDIIKHTFTKASHQYWRVIVNSSNDISMGRLFLGLCTTTSGIAYLIPQDVNSATKKTTGPAGQAYGDRRYFFDQVSARWPDLSEDEKNDLIDIFKTVDISKPFFITYDKAGATLGTMYVTFDMKSLKITPLGKRNLYTVTAKFREEVK